jgi:hypothetical protein
MQESPCHVRQIQDRLHKLLPSFATTAFTTMSRVNLEPQRPNVLMTNTCCWSVEGDAALVQRNREHDF